MSRTQRGTIDMLAGYTILYLDSPTAPEDDYYELGINTGNPSYTSITIWGVGLISFGPPTAAQKAFMANLASNSDLSTFPGDYVDFAFSTQQLGEIQIVQGRTWVDGVTINELGVTGGTSWSVGGLTGEGQFYWSDISVIAGSNEGEVLPGTVIPETLMGLDGDDSLFGGGGADALKGGAGNDALFGGEGFDRLWGDDGDDLLSPGVDFRFDGDPIIGTVDGGEGFDRLLLDYSAGVQSLVLDGSKLLAGASVSGVEALIITGTGFTDVISGGSSDDEIYGGGGFDLLRGGAGNDWLDAGSPTISSAVGIIPDGGQSSTNALSLDYLFATGPDGPTASFTVFAPSAMAVGWGLDPPAGTTYSFTVGAAGSIATIDYSIYAGSFGGYSFLITDSEGVEVPWFPWTPGSPIVFPHAGTYYLQAVVWNNNVWDFAELEVTLTLQSASVLTANRLEGGTGDDTYVVYSATDQVIEAANEGIDTVRSSVSWTLTDNLENLTLTGSDIINGTGNGVANSLIGNGAANALDGGGGNDALLGLAGADSLLGGAGNDVIGGGEGADTLTGGAGRDVFLFLASELGTSKAGPHDLVTDFVTGDRIDISALYQGAAFGGIKAGKASDIATISGFKAVYFVENGKTYLIGDTNGVAGADFAIEFSGTHRFSSGDLIVGKSAVKEWNKATGGLDYNFFHGSEDALAPAEALRSEWTIDLMQPMHHMMFGHPEAVPAV